MYLTDILSILNLIIGTAALCTVCIDSFMNKKEGRIKKFWYHWFTSKPVTCGCCFSNGGKSLKKSLRWTDWGHTRIRSISAFLRYPPSAYDPKGNRVHPMSPLFQSCSLATALEKLGNMASRSLMIVLLLMMIWVIPFVSLFFFINIKTLPYLTFFFCFNNVISL